MHALPGCGQLGKQIGANKGRASRDGSHRILIVGGGIADLTAAAALHQRGLTAEVIEHSPTWQAVVERSAVKPKGIRILRALGIGPAVETAGIAYSHR